jgi:hypothetical protein
MKTLYPIPNRATFRINPAVFAGREQYGPLTELERAYRIVASNDWTVFLNTDPFLATARLTAVGRRWLVPVIRQDYENELPVSMVDWIPLYRLAYERSLGHFRRYYGLAPQPPECRRLLYSQAPS